jgi:hypothetical protein
VTKETRGYIGGIWRLLDYDLLLTLRMDLGILWFDTGFEWRVEDEMRDSSSLHIFFVNGRVG